MRRSEALGSHNRWSNGVLGRKPQLWVQNGVLRLRLVKLKSNQLVPRSWIKKKNIFHRNEYRQQQQWLFSVLIHYRLKSSHVDPFDLCRHTRRLVSLSPDQSVAFPRPILRSSKSPQRSATAASHKTPAGWTLQMTGQIGVSDGGYYHTFK